MITIMNQKTIIIILNYFQRKILARPIKVDSVISIIDFNSNLSK